MIDAVISDLPDRLGPVGYLVVELPGGGAGGFTELLDLIRRDAIRVLDLEAVTKTPAGSVHIVDVTQVEAVAVFAGASAGLLDDDDLHELGELLAPGTTAAIIVYESVWALRLGPDVRLVADGPVSVEELDAVLGPVVA